MNGEAVQQFQNMRKQTIYVKWNNQVNIYVS